MNDDGQYDLAEAKLIPIVSEIEAIKIKITEDYIPEEYRDSKYNWNYNGWEIDKNKVEVYVLK